ncbi:MAG TPA: hypothetical protein VMH20_06975 [Verrucomicrobiae bacterium]|nr:hypothetical protein [Verrucomicrobiae bacterium]
MSTLLLIVVAAAVGALVLGLILNFRLRDQEVWEELVDPDVSANPRDTESATTADGAERYDVSMEEFDEPQNRQGEEEMTTPPLSQSSRSIHDRELRRSSRVERPVSLIVLGTNRRGEIFQERTAAVSVNLHGCRYTSRHEYAPEGWVTLQVTGTDGANSRPVRARVRSVYSAQNPRELCQVGVELESPGNIWGIPTPPEDWLRLIGANNGTAARAAGAVAPGLTAHTAAATPVVDRSAAAERKAEVTVFPGHQQASATPEVEEAAEKENQPTKAERVVITAEQLLQALQGKLQLAAEKAVQTALSTQLDDAVKGALSRIEEGWKANARQSEEFLSASRAEAQSLWEKELNGYRDRAEEVGRRIELLTVQAQQALADSQKFAERFAGEFAPQFQNRLSDSVARAHSDLETRAAEISSRHLSQLNENAQRAVGSARSQLDESVAQVRSFAETAAKQPSGDSVSREQLETQLAALRAEHLDRLEKRFNDTHAAFSEQVELMRNRNSDLASQLEGLALEARQARSQHEQAISDVRTLATTANQGLPQDQIHSMLNGLRDQILSHVEWRLGEVSGHYDQLLGQHHERANQLAQQLDSFANEARQNLAEARMSAEHAPAAPAAQELVSIQQSVGHATREFETTAARVSDRQLVRLMEQKQVVTQEAALELEARTSEARALLQKVSNNTIDDFRRRVEGQVEHVIAEATERVNSSFAALDAESRTVVEARRRTLEADVARAAEQSTAEFRSGIKAFLYSCLVAAVSAVDQHAQTTLAGLSSDPTNIKRALEAPSSAAANPEDLQFPPKSASNSQ